MISESSSRPKLKISPDIFDRIMQTLALGSVIACIAIPLYYYSSLPDVIPTHFNFSGEPDGYGSKSMIFWISGSALALYVLFTYMIRIPHKFNYIVEITTENAERQYRIAIKMVHVLSVISCGFFAYLVIQSTSIGLGKSMDLGYYSVGIFMLIIFGALFFFISRSISRQ